MRAISLWQPWASAIAIGAKRNETRHWPTNYRGPIAIHAAKKNSADLATLFHNGFYEPFESAGVTNFRQLPFGCVLLTCRLVDCVPTGEIRDSISELERKFGNYADGRFAWMFEDISVLDFPIPAKGAQGFWNWNKEEPQPVLFA